MRKVAKLGETSPNFSSQTSRQQGKGFQRAVEGGLQVDVELLGRGVEILVELLRRDLAFGDRLLPGALLLLGIGGFFGADRARFAVLDTSSARCA